jgi:hypothetical protein
LLTPETDRVWQVMKGEPLLSGFILIGGSALSLHLKHRMSEDLDLTFKEDQLPRKRLDVFIEKASAEGLNFSLKVDPVAAEEFTMGGLELEDYQQDFVVNGLVKVTFFTAEAPLCKCLKPGSESGLRIADLPELFKAKALVSARRSKSRDWLDLYLLMKNHGFTLDDYRFAFHEGGIPEQFETGLQRLCLGVPQKNDEGYAGLLENSPTIQEIASFFQMERDKFEQKEAAKLLGKRDGLQR